MHRHQTTYSGLRLAVEAECRRKRIHDHCEVHEIQHDASRSMQILTLS